MEINVIKRDGSKEPFSPHKIATVAEAAGATPEEAKKISEAVSTWAQGKSEITSIQIRDQVLEQLKIYDQYAANLFAWYQTTKDKKQETND